MMQNSLWNFRAVSWKCREVTEIKDLLVGDKCDGKCASIVFFFHHAPNVGGTFLRSVLSLANGLADIFIILVLAETNKTEVIDACTFVNFVSVAARLLVSPYCNTDTNSSSDNLYNSNAE